MELAGLSLMVFPSTYKIAEMCVFLHQTFVWSVAQKNAA